MASKLLRKAKLNNLLRTELVEQFSTLPHYDDLPSSEWIHWQTLKPRPRPGNAKIAHVRGKPRSPAVGQQRQGCSDLSRLINHGRGNQPSSFSHFPVLKAPGLKNHVSREALFPSRCSSSQLWVKVKMLTFLKEIRLFMSASRTVCLLLCLFPNLLWTHWTI